MQGLPTFSVLSLVATVFAFAVPEALGQLEQRDVQSVNLLFLSGPASYTLTIPADGNEYFTSRSLQVLPFTLQHNMYLLE